jgi:hypothetical protein
MDQATVAGRALELAQGLAREAVRALVQVRTATSAADGRDRRAEEAQAAVMETIPRIPIVCIRRHKLPNVLE